MKLKNTIEKLMRRENLDDITCEQAIDALLDPKTNHLQIAAFLVLLRSKGETADELAAIVKSLRNKMTVVETSHRVLDIVGTGGDGCHTINISTGSALLAASCGVKVAKHGNRAVSSLAGSADVLEALGVNIQLTPQQVSKCINEIGIGFCYSPNFHPATFRLRELRKQLNVATTFNILGPLLNPTFASHIILGVADKKLLPIIADVLINLGHLRSIVVHGNGLDEINCIGPFKIIEINAQQKNEYDIDPKEFGLTYCTLADLQGGDANLNAKILLETFQGKRGPVADTLILNAAIALYLYGIHATISEAIADAREKLFAGEVTKLLNNWIEFSHAT